MAKLRLKLFDNSYIELPKLKSFKDREEYINENIFQNGKYEKYYNIASCN